MRRFELTYKGDDWKDAPLLIEGVQFSNGVVVLELYPDNDWPGVREFRDFAYMEHVINEFGESAITWIDAEEAKESATP